MPNDSSQSQSNESKLSFVIFLGAGASKEFDIPLFREIYGPFLEDEKGKKYSKRLKKIKKELEKVGFPPDIENFISYSRGQIRPKDTILTMNPYVAYFVYRTMHPLVSYGICRTRTKNVGKDETAKPFLEDLEDFIYDTLLVHDSYMIQRIRTHYDDFFHHLSNRYYDGKRFEADIFTTNYDDSIELYCEDRKLSMYDGFNETPDGISYFQPELYKIHNIRLYKLHGSVRLGIVKDDYDNTQVIHSKKRIGIGEQYKGKWHLSERMMLLGYNKDISSEPAFELFRLLKDKLMLTEVCIVIGYSFGNGPILSIFKDVLRRRGPDFELVILCDNADQIKASKFSNDIRVRTIPDKFSGFNKI